MIPPTLLGALLGLGIATGIALIVAGFITSPPPKTLLANHPAATGSHSRRAAVAVIAAMFGFALTQWVAIAVVVGLGVWIFPTIVANRRGVVRDRERQRAIAQWIELLRDLLRSGSGIEESLVESAELVSTTPIGRDVARLRLDVETRGLRVALYEFGERLADPIADQAVAALWIAADRPSASVTEVLSRAAISARGQVARRERAEAARARTQIIVNTVVLTTVFVGAFLLVSQATYRLWYSTLTGQIFLCGGLGGQVALYSWMLKMSRLKAAYRTPITLAPSATMLNRTDQS
jgi:hypothetical protein